MAAGVPFRTAHRRTGELLKRLEDEGRSLRDLKEDEWAAFGLPDGGALLDPAAAVEARGVAGGPSPSSVEAQAAAIERALAARPHPA